MASLADLIPLVQQAKALGVPDAEIPGWIARLNQHVYQQTPVVTGQVETDREQSALQDAAAAQTNRAQTGLSLLDDAYRRSQQLIDLQRDPDNIVAYYAAIAGLPEASAQPVTDLVGQDFTLTPQLPSPYADPQYQQLQESLYDFGRPRTAAENIQETVQNRTLALNQQAADAYKSDPQAFLAMTQQPEDNLRKWFSAGGFAGGGDMTLREPVVGMGAMSGKPLFTAAEYGPEKMGMEGGRMKFTPMKGVPQGDVQPDYQMMLAQMAGMPMKGMSGGRMPAYAEGGGFDVGRVYEPDDPIEEEDIGKTRKVTHNPTTPQMLRPKLSATPGQPWDPIGRIKKAYAGEALPGTEFGPSTTTRGIVPSSGDVQYQRHPVTGQIQIVANPIGYPGTTLNEHADANSPGKVRQISPEERKTLAAKAFSDKVNARMAGAGLGDYSAKQLAEGAEGRLRRLNEADLTGSSIFGGGPKGSGGATSGRTLSALANVDWESFRNAPGIAEVQRDLAVRRAASLAGRNPLEASRAALAALPSGGISAVPGMDDTQIPRSNEQANPLFTPRAFASGGEISPVDATFDSFAKVLEKNPFVHPDMLNAVRNRTAPPPGSVTQRFLKNSSPSVWQGLQAAIRGKSGGTFLDDYLAEIPKFYHSPYDAYSVSYR
jgi:hypothetical protein